MKTRKFYSYITTLQCTKYIKEKIKGKKIMFIKFYTYRRWRSSMSVRPFMELLSGKLTTSWPQAPLMSWPICFRTVVRMLWTPLRIIWNLDTFSSLLLLNSLKLPIGLKGIKFTTWLDLKVSVSNEAYIIHSVKQ